MRRREVIMAIILLLGMIPMTFPLCVSIQQGREHYALEQRVDPAEDLVDQRLTDPADSNDQELTHADGS